MVGQFIAWLRNRHPLGQQLATAADAFDKPLYDLALSHPLSEAIDDRLPLIITDALHATVSNDFNIVLGCGDEDQNTGFTGGMVQVLLQKLPSRHVGSPPVANVARHQSH